MAETKKPVEKSEASKAADTKTSTAETPVAAPAATTEPVAETAKTEEKETAAKKPAGRKPGRKPGAKKPGRKPAAAKKETETKTTTTRKAAVKETVHVQFSGKTYTTEDLVKIAKDVWKYDLKKKVGDFKAVELYVKPEESVVYYVINGEEKGQFNI
ncbi:MAG: DNA-binding protein [Lachnospiraceae bacterium]|nr:DNA-binding protein [Lachnospiraceae bacterium]